MPETCVEYHNDGIGIAQVYLINFHFLSFTIAILALNMHIIVCDISRLGITVLVFSVHKAAKG